MLFIVFMLLMNFCCVKVARSQDLNKFRNKGTVIYNKPFFKNFAILMQDTSLSGNRFDSWFDMPGNQYFTTNPKTTVQYPAFIVDSALFFRSEEKVENPVDYKYSSAKYHMSGMQSDYPIIDWPTERPCPASAQKAGRRESSRQKHFSPSLSQNRT
jgi:hypothetical protein